MNRKLLTMLLCLLLVVALPISSLAAATERTFTIEAGDELVSAAPEVKDLLDVLAIKMITDEQGNSGAFVLSLDDVDVLTASARVETEGLYVQTNAVSEDVLFISWVDVAKAIEKNVEATGAIDINEMMEGIRQSVESVQNLPEVGVQAAPTDLQNSAFFMSNGDAELQKLVQETIDSMTVTSGTFEDALYDAADEKIELTITSDFYVKLMDTPTVREELEGNLAASNATLTDEELDEAVQVQLDKMKQGLIDADMKIDLTMLQAQGQPVMVNVVYTMKNAVVEGETKDVQVDMVYRRLTTADGITHKGEAVMVDAHMTLDAIERTDKSASGVLHMLSEGSQVTFQYEKTHMDEGNNHMLAVYNRENAVSVVELAASDRPMLTFNVQSKTVDGAVLKAVNDATVETSVTPMQMTGAEQEAFLLDAQTNLMRVFMGVMSYLPTSILQMFMVQQ